MVSSLCGCDVIYLLISELTEPNTELVVDHDGKISLKQQLGKTIWSFSTGSPIHSLYLAPLNAVNDTENATDISSTFLSRYMDYSEPTPLDDQVKIKRL